MLRPGYSTRRIASELKSAGVIRSEEAFVLWHYLTAAARSRLENIFLRSRRTSIDLQKRLRRGDVYFRTVVVPEGFTMFDIARAVEAAGLGPAEDFLKVAQSDTALIADLAPNATSLEGYLFPDTYEFSRMQTMQDMAAAMVKQFRQVAGQIGLLQPYPSEKPGGKPQILAYLIPGSKENPVATTVTMASIIEKETCRGRGAPASLERLLEPAREKRRARCRPQHYLCRAFNGNLHRRLAP